MGYEIKIDSWLEDAATLIRGIDVNSVADAAEGLLQVRDANGTMFLAGYGGSASTANHFANDMTKNAKIKTFSFSNDNLITCYSNDYGFENWIKKPLENAVYFCKVLGLNKPQSPIVPVIMKEEKKQPKRVFQKLKPLL